MLTSVYWQVNGFHFINYLVSVAESLNAQKMSFLPRILPLRFLAKARCWGSGAEPGPE